MHKGAVRENSEAVKAARELGVPVAEVWYDSKRQRVGVELASGASGKAQSGLKVNGSGSPNEDDVALLLHTSGTTGRPKAVPLVSTMLSRRLECLHWSAAAVLITAPKRTQPDPQELGGHAPQYHPDLQPLRL